MIVGAACVVALALGSPFSAPAGGDAFELYFELKLLLRATDADARVGVDQWAGGRLLAELTAADGEDGVGGWWLRLVEPIEHPWTFRWYPALHEAKLGAAVSVREPRGDPYRSLAALLTPEAETRYRLWWHDDRVESTAPLRPAFADRCDGFWSAQHRQEESRKDALAPAPVYPFYVLGEPRDRLTVRIDAAGGVVSGSAREQMSEPWLPRGWKDWRNGRREPGYGYWKRRRPAWEPATYQAFAAALELLAWPPKAADGDGVTRAVPLDLPSAFSRVIGTLQPRAARHLAWSGATSLRFRELDATPGRRAWFAESATLPLEAAAALDHRVWRYVQQEQPSGRPVQDELQLLVESSQGGLLRAWVKIGYRALDGPSP